MYVNTWTAILTLTSTLLLREEVGTKLWTYVIKKLQKWGIKFSLLYWDYLQESSSFYTAIIYLTSISQELTMKNKWLEVCIFCVTCNTYIYSSWLSTMQKIMLKELRCYEENNRTKKNELRLKITK